MEMIRESIQGSEKIGPFEGGEVAEERWWHHNCAWDLYL